MLKHQGAILKYEDGYVTFNPEFNFPAAREAYKAYRMGKKHEADEIYDKEMRKDRSDD